MVYDPLRVFPDRSVVRLVVMQHVPVGVQQPVRLQQLPHRQHTAYDLPQPFTVVARLAELCDVFAGGFDRRPEQFLFIPHLCRERGEIRRYGLRFHSAHHGGDKVEQLVHRERLVDAGRESGGGKSLPFLVTPCGHGDDRNRARIANIGIAQQFQQVKTVRSGHLYIRQEQVVVRFAYLPDKRTSIFAGRAGNAVAFKHLLDDFELQRVVVDGDDPLWKVRGGICVCTSLSPASFVSGRGSDTRNVLPLPTSLATVISPSSSPTSLFVINSPKPKPSAFISEAERSKGSKMRATVSPLMPIPVSSMVSRSVPFP